MKTVLESKGHNVLATSSAKECVEKFDAFKPDVVLLDLMMEQVDSGVTACQKIREKNSSVKIYLLSSVGDTAATTIDIHKTGFNGAMSKPVKANELIDLVG